MLSLFWACWKIVTSWFSNLSYKKPGVTSCCSTLQSFIFSKHLWQSVSINIFAYSYMTLLQEQIGFTTARFLNKWFNHTVDNIFWKWKFQSTPQKGTSNEKALYTSMIKMDQTNSTEGKKKKRKPIWKVWHYQKYAKQADTELFHLWKKRMRWATPCNPTLWLYEVASLVLDQKRGGNLWKQWTEEIIHPLSSKSRILPINDHPVLWTLD